MLSILSLQKLSICPRVSMRWEKWMYCSFNRLQPHKLPHGMGLSEHWDLSLKWILSTFFIECAFSASDNCLSGAQQVKLQSVQVKEETLIVATLSHSMLFSMGWLKFFLISNVMQNCSISHLIKALFSLASDQSWSCVEEKSYLKHAPNKCIIFQYRY